MPRIASVKRYNKRKKEKYRVPLTKLATASISITTDKEIQQHEVRLILRRHKGYKSLVPVNNVNLTEKKINTYILGIKNKPIIP